MSTTSNESINLAVWHTALPVLRELNRRSIPVIVLKSLPQIEELFGNLDERITLDVDLFVPASRVEEAFGVCLDAGFVPKTGRDYPDPRTLNGPHGRTALTERKWTIVPTETDEGYDLDLHNDGIARWRSAALRADVWSRARPVWRDGVQFQVLGPEDRLIFLCWLVTAEGTIRRKAADVAQVLRNAEELDWELIDSQSRRLGLALNTRLVCDLAVLWHDNADPRSPSSSTATGLPSSQHFPRPLPHALHWRYDVLLGLLRRCQTSLSAPSAQLVASLVYDRPLSVWFPALLQFAIKPLRRAIR